MGGGRHSTADRLLLRVREPRGRLSLLTKSTLFISPKNPLSVQSSLRSKAPLTPRLRVLGSLFSSTSIRARGWRVRESVLGGRGRSEDDGRDIFQKCRLVRPPTSQVALETTRKQLQPQHSLSQFPGWKKTSIHISCSDSLLRSSGLCQQKREKFSGQEACDAAHRDKQRTALIRIFPYSERQRLAVRL